MKESHKRIMSTSGKQQLIDYLSSDKIFNRIYSRCLLSDVDKVALICLADYCYQMGYDAGFNKGSRAGIEQVLNEISKQSQEMEKGKKDPG